ncbi:hypothetical protein QR77_23670 [Streptomyces sp. 150FB]|nr:hypothetical protein QR77_23670 [Streptomyces sp. 150FB]
MGFGEGTAVIDDGGYAAVTPWDEPQWRGEVRDWVAGALARHGLRATGAVRGRARPWSVVLRISLRGGGAVWFKANPPGSAFESALASALHAWAPGDVLEPLAVDTDRAWTLTRDGGPLLADVLDAGAGSEVWEEALGRYAELQRTLVPYASRLLDLGVPDFRPETLPDRLAALLDPGAVGVGALRPGERAALRALLPHFRAWCLTLAAAGIPASLDHSDLHEASVLTSGDRHVFFDWGDASLAHPFTTLLVVNGAVGRRYGEADAAAVRDRLRDAYLEPWTGDGHEPGRLRELAALACRVGVVGRADSWGRTFPGAGSGSDTAGSGENAARWLRKLLAGTPLPAGGAGQAAE